MNDKEQPKYRTKYGPINSKIKDAAMEEFIKDKITTKQIGNKYGFSKRSLRNWFKQANKLNEYEQAAKNNISEKSRRAMPLQSKLKISNEYNVFYKDGLKVEVKQNTVRGIKNRKKNKYIHRLIVEKHLNRELKSEEIVHHINLDPTNNELKNLILLKNSREHGLLHQYLQHMVVKLLSPSDLKKLTMEIIDIIRKEG